MLRYLLDGFLLAFLLWFALTGLREGLVGIIGRLLATLAALVAARLAIGPLYAFLESQPLFLSLKSGLAASILRILGRTAQSPPQAVAASGLPPLLQSSLLTRLAGGAAGNAGSTAGTASPFAALAASLAGLALTALVFMVLFGVILLLLRLVLQTISHLLNSLPVIGPLNRFAGFFAGAAYALLIVSVVLLLVTLAAPWLPGVAKAVNETTLLAWLYRSNPLLLIF